MKTKIQIAIITLASSFFLHAQQQQKGILGTNNWMNNWTNFKPASNEYNETTNIIAGTISRCRVCYQ